MKLRELFESRTKSVGIIFGRFNPPHKGHRAAWAMASKNDAWFVGTNQDTQGAKDPLPYAVKIQAMKAIYPEIEGHIIAEQSWLTMASKMYERFGDAVLRIYTDEEWVVKTVIDYNGREGPHGFYNFKNIEPVSTPRLSSATELRNAVNNNDREEFARAAGVSADTDINGHPFFDVVAKYLLPYTQAAAEKERLKAERERLKAEKERLKAAKKSKNPELFQQEEAAGVGIITKQNTTKDVNKGTLAKMMKGYRLI